MALSQKHTGKILVPWFNSEEWRYVYKLIYSDAREQKQEALNIIKIWKIRTPLLSSGIEGTLIILTAYLLDESKLEDEEICLLWASAVMRFLNICAANTRKQGTFYETARKNNLPDWLINIRHDIAHDQRIPSKYILKMALKYCLDWLKREYWGSQEKVIKDSEAPPENKKHTHIVQLLNVFRHVVQETISRDVTDFKSLSTELQEILLSQLSKRTSTMNVSQILTEMSSFILAKVNEHNCELFCHVLADQLLGTKEYKEEVLDCKKVPEQFLTLWDPLLKDLRANNLLILFITKLHAITINENNTDSDRKYASLWLHKILQGLLELKEKSKDADNFLGNERFICEIENFRDRVLKKPNMLTLNYLSPLLKLNSQTDESIREIKTLITSYTQAAPVERNRRPKSTCYTLKEVHPKLEELLEVTECINISPSENVVMGSVKTSRRWTLIGDTSGFKGCPLGVLPHQTRAQNPVLPMEF